MKVALIGLDEKSRNRRVVTKEVTSDDLVRDYTLGAVEYKGITGSHYLTRIERDVDCASPIEVGKPFNYCLMSPHHIEGAMSLQEGYQLIGKLNRDAPEVMIFMIQHVHSGKTNKHYCYPLVAYNHLERLNYETWGYGGAEIGYAYVFYDDIKEAFNIEEKELRTDATITEMQRILQSELLVFDAWRKGESIGIVTTNLETQAQEALFGYTPTDMLELKEIIGQNISPYVDDETREKVVEALAWFY
jgi:hypothetical protein